MVDAVFVGSGINSMVGGALLARAGWRVCILERNPWLGGAIHTTELTVPGFRHEVFSSWHPLFTSSGAYAELGEELGRRGVEYLNTDLPTATLFPDGEAAFLTTDLDANVADRTATEWRVAMFDELPGERRPRVRRPHAPSSGRPRAPARGEGVPQLGRRGLVEFSGKVLATLPRLARGDVPRRSARTGCWRRGCSTRASAPTPPRPASCARSSRQRCSSAACPCRAAAARCSSRRSRESSSDAGGETRTDADVERGARRRRRRARRPARSRRGGASPAARSSATSRRTSSTAGCSPAGVVPAASGRGRRAATASGARACRSTTRSPSGPTGRATSACSARRSST